MRKQEIPGVAVAVMKGDQVILARGYGVTHASRADGVTENTVFALNSLTKQFVAARVLRQLGPDL